MNNLNREKWLESELIRELQFGTDMMNKRRGAEQRGFILGFLFCLVLMLLVGELIWGR